MAEDGRPQNDVPDNAQNEVEHSVFTSEELDRAIREYNEERQRFDVSPTNKQLLGQFTIFCLVMNRTIGSGIFTVPPKVLGGTGSIGGALLVWAASGIIVLCGALCWLELGMTIPIHTISENGRTVRVSAPRSGGEKNYLEYIFKRPEFFMTCVFGIMAIVLGNLAGNAVAFGIYIMIAAGRDPVNSSADNYQKGPVIGLAIVVLTVCAFLHVFSRRGGIWINNAFAVMKIGILIAIAILGFVHASGKLKSKGINDPLSHAPLNITSAMINNAKDSNFDPFTSFHTTHHDVGSVVSSFIFAIYPFSGFEQPFYVLSEVARPKTTFPRATITAILTALVLYMLVNVSYFCVVPQESYLNGSNTIDMADAFLHDLFDSTYGPHTAQRVMAALIAFSIFGNILVLTFTAARVKQEIAKEGILPKSLFFATGHATPWARFRARGADRSGTIDINNHLEQTPMAALGLHWFTSIFLVLVTAVLQPATAYSFLVTLYSYVNVAILGCLTAGGLLYLKLDSWYYGKSGRNWAAKASWKPPLDPLHAIIYFCSMAFLLFASFVKPADNSPFSKAATGYWWFLVPAIGLSSLGWGVAWWSGLEMAMWKGRWRLVVKRTPYLERDEDGNYVQKLELVEHETSVRVGGHRHVAAPRNV